MIEIHPVFFFCYPYFKILFLKSGCSCQNSVQAPPTIVDWQERFTLALPPWVSWELSSGAGKTRYLQLSDWGVLLLYVIMNIAVVIYSRHLTRWRRTQRIKVTLIFKVNAPLYTCISLNIHLIIIMLNARWLTRQRIWSGRIGIYTYLWSAHHSMKERVGVSRAH